MIHLEPKHLQGVQAILKKFVPQYEVWAFGSRVHGRGLKKFSDLDLVIIADHAMPPKLMTQISDFFSESNLPFRVDITEWNGIDESFQEIIRDQHVTIQDASPQ